MRRLLPFALAVFALLPSLAWAEQDTVPIEHPVATFTRPEGWPGYPDDNGVLTVSADGKVNVGMKVIKAGNDREAEKTMLDVFRTRKVTVFPPSRHEAPARRVGGISARVVVFSGRDYDGQTQIVLTLVKLRSPDAYLAISEMGPPFALRAQSGALARMLGTVRMLK